MQRAGLILLTWTDDAQKVLNTSLSRARDAKQDEFYTQLTDIERELKHYKKHFRNKVVYCNCDDPRVSNFFHGSVALTHGSHSLSHV
ncbi:MAG: adenine-specific methyltransferase EcoRI family protein [Janthinobacterium lividum]